MKQHPSLYYSHLEIPDSVSYTKSKITLQVGEQLCTNGCIITTGDM